MIKKYLFLSYCLFAFTQVFAQQQATLLGQWSDPSLVGSSAYNNTYNEIWGLAVGGHEYAVIGSTAGTHFIDVTDTANIHEAHFVAGAYQGAGVIHRDYHDYQGYLYAVCDEGASSTLQIIDVSTLPDSISVAYDSQTLLRQAHNIFIDTSSARMYALAGNYSGGYLPMGIFDISNPIAPTFVSSYSSFSGVSFGHVHDAFVRNDTAYLNCGYDGFLVVDFDDPASPQLLGQLTSYAQQGYNHSGWLTNDGQYYYMADENHDKDMKILDVSDMLNIEVKGFVDAGSTSPFSIPHNQLIKGDLLFTSYYYDGLQIHDISDPLNPVRKYYYDTYLGAHNNSYEGAWGVYPYLPSGKILVSDMQTGLYVLELPTSVSTTPVTQNMDFKTYPQPFDDYIQIEMETEDSGDLQVTLWDITGRKVADLGKVTVNTGANQFKISVPQQIVGGLYMLNIQGEQMNLTKKVMKQ